MPEPRAISGTGKGKPMWVKSHSQECPGAGNQPRAPGRTLVPSGGGSSVLKKQGYKVEVHQKKQNQGIISWNMGIVAGRSQSRAGTRPPLGCGVRARGVRTGITLEFVLFSSGLRKPGVPHHVHQSWLQICPTVRDRPALASGKDSHYLNWGSPRSRFRDKDLWCIWEVKNRCAEGTRHPHPVNGASSGQLLLQGMEAWCMQTQNPRGEGTKLPRPTGHQLGVPERGGTNSSVFPLKMVAMPQTCPPGPRVGSQVFLP